MVLLRLAVLTVVMVIATGCASTAVRSTLNGESGTAGGVHYQLPLGRVKVAMRLGYAVAGDTLHFGGLDAAFREPVVAPDPSANYFLQYLPSAFSDDQLCLAIGDNGMLSSVQFAAADRSADIIQRVAESAALLAGGPAGRGPAIEYKAIGKPEIVFEIEPFVELTFDPASSSEIDRVQATLKDALRDRLDRVSRDSGIAKSALPKDFSAGIKKVAFTDVERRQIADSPGLFTFSITDSGARTSRAPASAPGVFFRTSTARTVKIKPIRGEEREQVVLLPDPSSTSWLPINRARFVKKTSALTLKDGALVVYEVNKPSEGFAVASLPLNIAGAVIETPARFFTVIGNSFRSETAMIKARAELVKAEAELEKVKQGQTASSPDGKDASATSIALGGPLNGPASPEWKLTCVKKDAK